MFLICIFTAGFVLLAGSNNYAALNRSLQDTSRTDKGMQTDTGMTQRSHDEMNESTGGMKAMMGEMRDSMMNVQRTGDPDEDFAAMMIQHHKGAIRMSENEVNKGKDQKIITMAEKTIMDQQSDIQKLQKFVKTDQSGMSMHKDSSMHRRMDTDDMTGSAEHKMMSQMQNMQMTGDQDNDYVSMMIMHHQHAIDMANTYLDKGKNEDLIRLAKQMIKSNQDDIKDLEDWKMNK
ncbi:MAG: DUF305 domain-containing protein [Ignavibacteria bacterium]|jgi:uncharacterized protein (DUF305 family)|nr:DUF305 domain-containing protein [Ignavibacteria bacterium]